MAPIRYILITAVVLAIAPPSVSAAAQLSADDVKSCLEAAFKFKFPPERGSDLSYMNDWEGKCTRFIDSNLGDQELRAYAYYSRSRIRAFHAIMSEPLSGAPSVYQDTVNDLDMAIKLAPNESSFFFERGKIYLQQKNLDAAIADMDRAIALDPKGGIYYTYRGKILSAKGDSERARLDYATGMRLDAEIKPK